MYLHRLRAEGFRNLASLDLSIQAAPAVIWGDNGQGKSNLLEAVMFGCTGRLWRSVREEEAIGWGKEIARVRVEVRKAGHEGVMTEVALGRGQKPLFKINGVSRRRGDFAGLIPVVGFSAEDLQIVKGDPGRRREFLNQEIGQLSRSYYWNLRHYLRSLEQRNRLLKELREGRGAPEELQPWEAALAKHGGKLVVRRQAFLDTLQQKAAQHAERLHPGWKPLSLAYRPALGEAVSEALVDAQEVEAVLTKSLLRSRSDEIARGFSLVGPHRDEFEVLLGEIDQRIYGSQGQQRGLVVALRLGLAEMLEEELGEQPILLLDDIFSELDDKRRSGLYEALGPQRQFLLTTPTREEVPRALLEKNQVYRVQEGVVLEQSEASVM